MVDKDTKESLKESIKRYLRIDDDEDDDLIINFIENGESHLDDIAGSPQDYSVHGLPRSILYDYVRYAYSQALEVFDHNFCSDLLMLHMKQFDNLKDDGDGSDAD